MTYYEEVVHDERDKLYGPTIVRSKGDPNVVLTGPIDLPEAEAEPADPELETVAPDAPPAENGENTENTKPGNTEPTAPTAPPKSGAGSGRDEWVAYAAAIGVEVDPEASRDEIIAAVESHNSTEA